MVKREGITPKKRFEVFERDNFRCRYCGMGADRTVLEIDHITPVAQGGDSSFENLVTSCHSCNRGKGQKALGNNETTYKTKINDTVKKVKLYVYEQRNTKYMGTICQKTKTLLSLYINDYIGGEAFYSFLPSPIDPETPTELSKKLLTVQEEGFLMFDYEKGEYLFKNGGDYCDTVLDSLFERGRQDLDRLIEEVFDDGNRNVPEQYGNKLNYKLTDRMADSYAYDKKGYVLMKFTLYPDLVKKYEV